MVHSPANIFTRWLAARDEAAEVIPRPAGRNVALGWPVHDDVARVAIMLNIAVTKKIDALDSLAAALRADVQSLARLLEVDDWFHVALVRHDAALTR